MSKQPKPPRKPRNLATVITWLNSQGLQVYGDALNLETGRLDYGCMDYNLEAIERNYILRKTDKLLPCDSGNPFGTGKG